MLQIAIYLIVLLLLVKPLGYYIAMVYQGQAHFLSPVLGPIERGIYKICSIEPNGQNSEMDWKTYASSMLVFSFLGIVVVFALQRLQIFLPLNPEQFPAVEPSLAFNTAASFSTNTDWQAYSGEKTLSYFTQMLALTVQNFLSASVGLSILMALIRGIERSQVKTLGNFWVDLTRGVLYIFLPLAVVLALFLVSEGVIQNFKPYVSISSLEKKQSELQILPMGPVASQVAIKQLGTNGGGFFNTNSAHPFENPSPISNFLEMLAIMLIPMALCYTFGVMVKDKRQGWAIFCAMLFIFIPFMLITVVAEHQENPIISKLFDSQTLLQTGNMEGKETRFGIINSAVWASATTATSNGSVNAMLDSFLPIGGLVPLWLMNLAETVFGGVGSGLYQMIIFIIISVFICGLMVGRTPEYLGKKIESYEMKLAAIAMLIMPLAVLLCTAMSLMLEKGVSSLGNPGTHGFTEILYAFSSMANNNGSAFAGLNANTSFYNTLGGVVILMGRYWIAISILAIAGSLAQKKSVPVSAGTLPTHTPLFIGILVGVILITMALTFLPALSLGPIAEQFILYP